jgi:hypothetical protein
VLGWVERNNWPSTWPPWRGIPISDAKTKRSTREVAVKILKHARSLQGGTSLLLATRVCRRPKQGRSDLKEDSVKIFLDIPCYTPKKDRKVIHHSFSKLFLPFSLGFSAR